MTAALGNVAAATEHFGGELRIGGELDAVNGQPNATARETGNVEGPSFASVLEKTVMAANTQEQTAVAKAEALAAGKTDDLHGTMIAMKEADISLKLVGNVRNKLLDAFHELWRTSV